jgi:hypothetical protein
MIDARLPLAFGREDDAGPADALLIEGEGAAAATRDYFTAAPETGHPANCACCLPRNAAGMALSRLLLARARAHGARFNRVIAVTHTEGGRAAVIQAVEQDPLASACFRLR